MHPPQSVVRTVMEILRKTYVYHPMHDAFTHNPFQMLVAVVLSQRATDAMTIPTAKVLFAEAPTPQAILALPIARLETLIRPIGFYHAKAVAVRKLCAYLLEHHNGSVPGIEEELLKIPQVGRKTANIMLTLFFDTPQIAVDVHVHRITHRLGWVRTKTPEQTEVELTHMIPKEYLYDTNRVFVRHGQEICKPISPKCSVCPILAYCPRIGVTTSR